MLVVSREAGTLKAVGQEVHARRSGSGSEAGANARRAEPVGAARIVAALQKAGQHRQTVTVAAVLNGVCDVGAYLAHASLAQIVPRPAKHTIPGKQRQHMPFGTGAAC